MRHADDQPTSPVLPAWLSHRTSDLAIGAEAHALAECCGDPFQYEWVMEDSGHSGISMTPHGAMAALAGTLIQHHKGSGFVRPVTLRHDGEDWTYHRLGITHRAICRNGVLTWR